MAHGDAESSRRAASDAEDDADDVWADAEDHDEARDAEDADVTRSGPPEQGEQTFTTSELEDLLRDAEDLKARGNDHFANSKADETLLEKAAECYRQALDRLPALESSTEKAPPPPLPASSGVVELTDAEAAAIEAQDAERNAPESDDERRRREANEGITQVRKALWANLGAVWVRKGDDKQAIEACSEALKIDPDHVKALQRRAGAGDRLGTWTSLTQAQEDYTRLVSIGLPPIARSARASLRTLPARIAHQQEKEKAEMMAKLKELGNGLLGRFGLSTDNFKFDEQPGGGYSMRFER